MKDHEMHESTKTKQNKKKQTTQEQDKTQQCTLQQQWAKSSLWPTKHWQLQSTLGFAL